MQRVSVVGNSGSGKTTLAAALAARLGVPHLELDAVFHQPGWTELARPQFRSRVSAFVAAERWVVDGNYRVVQDLVWARADTVVWIDLPRAEVMRRLVFRTLLRAATRRELWNGNRERWANVLSADPQRSIIAWAWTQHDAYRDRYKAAATDPAYAHVDFVRIGSTLEARALLRRAG